MSELKVAIGKKIRELREAGDSIPSLLTLEFIAQQLRIEMYQIIKESSK